MSSMLEHISFLGSSCMRCSRRSRGRCCRGGAPRLVLRRCAVRLHLDLPVRLVVRQAVAAGAGGLAEAADQPILGYVARLTARPLPCLVLLSIPLILPREVLLRFYVVSIAFVVVVCVHILEVRRPRDRW